MSIYKRGGVWWYHFWFEGQHIQRPTKLTSRKMALRIESVHKAQLALGKHGLAKKENPKFSDFAARYLKYSEANKPAFTVERYYVPRALVPFLGRYRLNEISAYTVEKFKQKRLDAGLKKSSINREVGLVKSMLSTAVKWELVETNGARDAKLFKLDGPPVERVLSYEEEAKLLQACDHPELHFLAPHLKPIILVAVYTGLRRGEILRLRWADIDLDNGILIVRKSKTRAGQGRVMYVNAVLRATLQQWREEVEGEWVFPSPKNSKEHVGDIKHSFCRAVKIAEIPHITFHQLRHTFCSRLSDAGVPLAVIQELAGHASIVMTRRYMHPANELKRKAVELILAPGKVAEPATKAATTALQSGIGGQERRPQLVVQ
ncbi:MAG: site-specific integrase [Terriglobia bacterium]